MKFLDVLNQIIEESKKGVSERGYGFGHAYFDGRKVSARTLEVNTNSKRGVHMVTFELDGKRIGKNKLINTFA